MIEDSIGKKATMIIDFRNNKKQKCTAVYLNVPYKAFDDISIYVKKITRINNLKNRIIYVDVNYAQNSRYKRGLNVLKQDIKRGNIQKIFIRTISELYDDENKIDDFINLCEKYRVSINYIYE